MENYFKRKPIDQPSSSNNNGDRDVQSNFKRSHVEVDFNNLPSDPALRIRMSDYNPNDRDQVRRAYLLNGPCQPKSDDFPQTLMAGGPRRFKSTWYTEFGDWLEYSVSKNAIFCLHCYLFRPSGLQGGSDAFVIDRFSNWKQKDKLRTHVGSHNSAHNLAYRKGQNLLHQNQNIETILFRQTNKARSDYRIRLNASVDVIRFLLRQGLAFRGCDESEESSNQGNFLELLRYTADHNSDIDNVVLKNAPGNIQMIAPDIQKDIVNACSVETTAVILKDLGVSLFAILIDESRDTSIKEQMAVVIRFVNTSGCVVERFLGIVHVNETTSLSLKVAIEALFSKHGLSMKSLRGQGYDGASNMQGKFNGLQALIMKENKSAFYVHCFAHQLQLAVVGVAKNEPEISSFFNLVLNVSNVVGASCKRMDKLRESRAAKVIEALNNVELPSGKGLNQERSLKRPGDTRWGSHYGTLVNLIIMFSSVIDVLEDVIENGLNAGQRGEACGLISLMLSFEFILNLHMMKSILGITNDLSQSLQKKDQEIVNAMALVTITKKRLQLMRDDGWDSLLNQVSSFCDKHKVLVPQMDAKYQTRRGPQRGAGMTNLHHYRVELFYKCLDRQMRELDNRFNEVNTELLLCMACLNPSNMFKSFDKCSLIRLAELYPSDFSQMDLVVLEDQLENYIFDVRSNCQFVNLNGISELAQKMVDTRKNIVYQLVYKLIILALILPVAIATVERAFSAMHIVKGRLRNRMGDEWMNDCLVTYIEKDIFTHVDNELILQRFQQMKTRRGQL